jgi:hypothetical protein
MKRFLMRIIFLFSVIIFLYGCASTTDTVTDNEVKTGGTVPGEKTDSDAIGATAGPGSAAAGVKW